MTPALSPHEQFAKDGYLVLPGVVDPGACVTLLDEVIRSLAYPSWSYIHESGFRTHCPVPLTPDVGKCIRACLDRAPGVLAAALPRRRWLVELSSIIVFPHAEAQRAHQDANEPGKHIVTVFVNLVPTTRDVGALGVVPGSHVEGRSWGAARVLELSTGSAVFMDGRLTHGGMGNGSVDRIRPVLYFSFGDDDIRGPTYSIRPEYRTRFDLTDFSEAPTGFAGPSIEAERSR